MEYIMCLALFAVGLYALIAKMNMAKMIIGISLMGYAVNLLFVLAGYRADAAIPIFRSAAGARQMVDPLPQAIVLTTVVIGLATVLLLVAVALRVYRHYGTLDISEIRKLKG